MSGRINSAGSGIAGAQGLLLPRSVGRRRFLAGSVATVVSTSALARGSGSRAVTPEDFGAKGDLNGDAGTDNTAAFRRMADHLNTNGGHARLGGRYRISGGFALFRGTLEFTGNALIRNTADGRAGPWGATCLFVGTYFGGVTGSSSLNAEVQYVIEPMAAGADRFRVVGGTVPPTFVPGVLVYLKDGRRYTGAKDDLRIATHVSLVVRVEGDIVVLRDASPHEIAGAAGAPPTALTPSNALALDTRLGLPIPTTHLAHGVRIVNGAFETKRDNAGKTQTVHVACHDCDLDFRWLAGSNCLGINPCSDSRISVRDASCTNVLYELAYFHARVQSEIIRGTRRAGQAVGGVAPVQVSEYGHSVLLNNVEIDDRAIKGAAWVPAVGIYSPMTQIARAKVSTMGGNGIVIGSAGQRGDGSRIGAATVSGAEIAMVIDADDIVANRVELTRANGSQPTAVLIRRLAGRNITVRSTTSNFFGVRDERPAA